MKVKSKSYKISLILLYVSLAVFLLSLLVVYTSSNEHSEFFPSNRDIAYFIYLWIILPICFLLSITGCTLAVVAAKRIQYKHFIIGFTLNLCMILAYCGYLWAYHSDFIYHTFEMNPRARMEYAVENNKLWMVKWELMRGAGVDRKYWYNETLLMRAVRNRNRKLMHVLLDYNPDVNIYSDINGTVQTPLMHIAGADQRFPSIRMHRRITLRQLRTQNARNRKHGTGIMALSDSKQKTPPNDWKPHEIARLLLGHGADPDLRLKSSDRKRSYKDVTAVSLAYDNGKSDLVDLLLRHGADVNVKIRYQEQTLLYAAVGQNDVEMVIRLIDLGAELDVKDNDTLDGSKSPLQMAVVFEDIECAKVLIANGANVNIMFSKGIGGNSPLHLAVMTENMEIVQLLLNHGADVNAKEINGKTPLHLAVDFSQDKIEIVKLLLEHGANPDVSAVFSDRRGEKESHTPLSLAQKKQYSAVANVLFNYEVKI